MKFLQSGFNRFIYLEFYFVFNLSTEQGRVQRIGQLINQLPKVNYENLWWVFLEEFYSNK